MNYLEIAREKLTTIGSRIVTEIRDPTLAGRVLGIIAGELMTVAGDGTAATPRPTRVTTPTARRPSATARTGGRRAISRRRETAAIAGSTGTPGSQPRKLTELQSALIDIMPQGQQQSGQDLATNLKATGKPVFARITPTQVGRAASGLIEAGLVTKTGKGTKRSPAWYTKNPAQQQQAAA